MPSASTEWKPNEELTAVDVAFPATVSHLMPPYSDIPEDFRNMNSQNRWTKFQGDWFFKGLKNLKVSAKDGIDATKAMRHLSCINGSFEPKHEHKRAAVAYLASLWFDDIKYETAK